MLANVWNKSGRQIIVEIEQVLSQIIQRNALGHVIRILVEIAKPHFLVLPISESNRRHPRRFYRYCSSGQYTTRVDPHEVRRRISAFALSHSTNSFFLFLSYPPDVWFDTAAIQTTEVRGDGRGNLLSQELCVRFPTCRSIYCPLGAALSPALIASASVMYLPFFVVP